MKQNEIKKPSLMDYTKASLEIIQLVEDEALENDGAISEALSLETVKNEELFQDKALKTGFAALRIASEATFIDERIKELSARKKALKNASDRLKDYLKYCMISTERKQIKSDMLSITVKNTAVWPEITNEAQIPDKYLSGKLTFKGSYKQLFELQSLLQGVLRSDEFNGVISTLEFKADKKLIREAMLDGKPVPGAFMPEQSNSITIK